MRGSIQKKTLNNGTLRWYAVYDRPQPMDDSGSRRRRQKWEAAPPPNTKKAADRLLAERLSQIHRNEFTEPKQILFRDYVDLWIKNYARGQVAQSTLSLYDSIFRNHLIPAFGGIQLAGITAEATQALSSEKLADGLAPQTVKHILRLMKQMLDQAVEWDYLRHNPTKKVRFPKIPRHEMDFLTPDEVRAFFSSVPKNRYAFYVTAIMTGLRVGEIIAMKWANIDWRRRTYSVRESFTRRRSGVAGGFSAPKTEDSAANVHLSVACLRTLKDHRAVQAQQKLKMGAEYEDNDLIFATDHGRPLDHKNRGARQFHADLKAAGLRRIRFHDLRHTCAALLIDQGESAKFIQRQLRHTSIQTTMDRYGHLLPEHGREAMSRLDERLFGAAQPRDLTAV